jgi:D-glycero-alpha-D-manno-heptose 1-phosphate guanylyltransferase
MQAIILLGGKGTRLQSLYPDRPKALVPIAGRPFIEWQIEWLRRGGIHDFHLAAGHMADAIQRWADEPKDYKVTVSCEPTPLGTGGGLKYIEPFIRSDPFLVLNGDSLLPNLAFQTLEELLAAFPRVGKSAKKSKPAGIVVTRIEQAGRYGTVEFDEHGRITAFLEKQDRQNGWVNGGLYVVPTQILELITAGRPVSMETEVFPELARKGLVMAIPCPAPLLDMGTPDGIAAMEAHLGLA